MSSLNKVQLIGNLARDPEIKQMNNGEKLCNLTLATSEKWRDKATGESKEKAEFHRVVLFNDRLADVAERFLKKGRKVYIEGALQTRKWTDQQGQDRYSTEVVLGKFRGELVLLDSAKDGGGDAPYQQEQAPQRATQNTYGTRAPSSPQGGSISGPPGGDLDDEIPFGPCWQ
jgi:single-strand DNA-binding protein